MRVLQFVLAVTRRWGILVTGGVVMGVIGIWQGSGHAVDPRLYEGIAALDVLVAIFRAWSEQAEAKEKAEKRIAELEGRPEITLDIEDYKSTANNPPDWGGAHVKQRFMLSNGGNIQSVNLTIEAIPLPMADFYKRQIGEMAQHYSNTTGEPVPEREPGWDTWVVSFEELANVAPGAKAPIGFSISNMGPLQNRDLCNCMGNSVRDGFGPLTVPLSLRFSNRDGATWIQHYDLEHKLKCSFRLIYRGVELVGLSR
jgi:hypothetical protein